MKNLNEQVSRIKDMMGITNSNDTIVDCDMDEHDSDTMKITVMYDQEDKHETYLISVEFEYEEGESQSYDSPGYDGGAYGSVDGMKMIHPEQKILSPEEIKNLLSNEHVRICVSHTMEEMENDAYESKYSGPDPDDYYDRMRDDD
jgi:hypothetical protein